jgi:hypothetical protein
VVVNASVNASSSFRGACGPAVWNNFPTCVNCPGS